MAATLSLAVVLGSLVASTFCSWSSFNRSLHTPLQTPFFAANYFKFKENLIRNEIHTINWITDIRVINLSETKQLKNEIIQHGVVKIKRQLMTRADQVVLSQKLGELLAIPKAFSNNDAVPEYPSIAPICNYWQNGTWKGKTHAFGQMWHKDHDYAPFNKGYVLSMLYADQIEAGMIGGETGFIDGCALVKRIPREMLENIKNATLLVGILDIPHLVDNATEEEIKMFPRVRSKVIFKHPGKDEECVYLWWNTLIRPVEKVNPSETQRLLHLWDYMQNPSYVMTQRWEDGDIVIWDNFGVFHRALPLESSEKKRMLYRTHIRLKMGDR